MKKFFLILLLTLPYNSFLSQNINGSFNNFINKKHTTFLSPGVGIAFRNRYGEWNNSFNISVDLNIHSGKGYYTGIGLLNHPVPNNKSNKLTYLYIQERKGFYLINNFAVFGGIGGTIGVSTKGHPGCCVGGAYFTILASYDLVKYISMGFEVKSITDFTDVTMIPGFQFILKFY